jgi:hypothetical protein
MTNGLSTNIVKHTLICKLDAEKTEFTTDQIDRVCGLLNSDTTDPKLQKIQECLVNLFAKFETKKIDTVCNYPEDFEVLTQAIKFLTLELIKLTGGSGLFTYPILFHGSRLAAVTWKGTANFVTDETVKPFRSLAGDEFVYYYYSANAEVEFSYTRADHCTFSVKLPKELVTEKCFS